MQNHSLQFLKSQIDERVISISKNRNYYRKIAFNSHMGTAVLSAIIGLALGLNICEKTGHEITRILSIILTSTIAILNAYQAFFNHKELWIENNQALNNFYHLKFDIEFAEKSEGDLSVQTIEEYKRRYQEILDELNKTWVKNRLDTHKYDTAIKTE